jgi:hypothetical protein
MRDILNSLERAARDGGVCLITETDGSTFYCAPHGLYRAPNGTYTLVGVQYAGYQSSHKGKSNWNSWQVNRFQDVEVLDLKFQARPDFQQQVQPQKNDWVFAL